MTKFTLLCSAVLFAISAGCATTGNSPASHSSLQPPVHVQMAVERMGKADAEATLRVCIDPKGSVESVDVVKSSGVAAYDEHLKQVASAWNYKEKEGDSCRLVSVEYDDKA